MICWTHILRHYAHFLEMACLHEITARNTKLKYLDHCIVNFAPILLRFVIPHYILPRYISFDPIKALVRVRQRAQSQVHRIMTIYKKTFLRCYAL